MRFSLRRSPSGGYAAFHCGVPGRRTPRHWSRDFACAEQRLLRIARQSLSPTPRLQPGSERASVARRLTRARPDRHRDFSVPLPPSSTSISNFSQPTNFPKLPNTSPIQSRKDPVSVRVPQAGAEYRANFFRVHDQLICRRTGIVLEDAARF